MEEKMKLEAIKRMQQLKLDEDVIRAFKENDILRCSDYGRIIDVPADVRKEIRAWEEKYNNLVYHVIHSGIYGVETYNCLSVSCYPEDWDYENMRLNEGWPMCYSINKTIPDFTESGTIKVEHDKGSLMRIG